MAAILGVFIRLLYITKSTFPINDGGLFFVMVKDLVAGGFSLPVYTTYNNAQIPFAYAPLSFYLLGFLHQFLRIDLLELFRFVPLIFNLLTVPAFYGLARTILKNRASAAYGTFVFALLFPAFEGLIMGGGVTRSPGYLFSLLAMQQIALAAQSHRTKDRLLAVLFTAATALFHLEMLWTTAIAALWLLWRYARNGRGILNLAVIFGAAGLLTAPYWLTIILRHGLSPFIAAMSAGEFSLTSTVFKSLIFNLTDERFVTLFAILALIGLLRCLSRPQGRGLSRPQGRGLSRPQGRGLSRREYGLAGWLALILIFNSRSVNRSAAVLVAMLAGIAIHEVILPGMNRLSRAVTGSEEPDGSSADTPGLGDELRSDLSAKVNRGVLSFLLLFAFVLTYLSQFANDPVLSSLSNDDRQAMEWVTANTPPASRFAIMPSYPSWHIDKVFEWFPALTGRTNLTTVQGSEWLAGDRYGEMRRLYDRLQDCPFEPGRCTQILSSDLGAPFDYVYVHVDRHKESKNIANLLLIHELEASPAYTLVYQTPTVTIFAREGD